MGYTMALLAALLWGVQYTIDERILLDMTPAGLLLVNFALFIPLAPLLVMIDAGSPAPSALAHQIGRYAAALHANDGALLWLLAVAQIVTVSADYSIYAAIKYIGATRASLFEITYPAFVALCCWGAFGQRPTPSLIIGGGFMLVGAVIIVRYP